MNLLRLLLIACLSFSSIGFSKQVQQPEKKETIDQVEFDGTTKNKSEVKNTKVKMKFSKVFFRAFIANTFVYNIISAPMTFLGLSMVHTNPMFAIGILGLSHHFLRPAITSAIITM